MAILAPAAAEPVLCFPLTPEIMFQTVSSCVCGPSWGNRAQHLRGSQPCKSKALRRAPAKVFKLATKCFKSTPDQAAIKVLRGDQPALPNVVHARVLNRQVHGRQQGGVRPVIVVSIWPDA